MNYPNLHQPVLADRVLEFLKPARGQSYLDLTAGYGGHAAAVLAVTGKPAAAVLVDRDPDAIAYLKQRFKTATIITCDYATAAKDLRRQRFEMILIDLGVNSAQLDQASRGFSIRHDGPLDMRMDPRQQLTAADIINGYARTELANLIYQLGEERRSRQIAAAIVKARPVTSTAQLAEVVQKTYRNYSKIHPATRTFQALRIAVNDELGQLEAALPLLPQLLTPGGRLAIISFHSLEDRLVKQWLRSTPELTVLTKKAVLGKQHDESNPRARSARLRAAVKNKN